MARLLPFLVSALLVSSLAACGGSGSDGEPTEVAVFSNAVPLPDYEGEEGFVLQIAGGAEPTTLSSDSGATVLTNLDAENAQTGTPMTQFVFAQGDDAMLTLYLPLGLEAVPYPLRSWEALDSSVTTVFASVQYGGQEFTSNLLGTLRVSEVGDGKISATFYFDGQQEEGGARVTVAGDFRGLNYPGTE